MRYAIFSDIHGNRPAWDAVLADMEELEVQIYVCLGDVVGYGPCPQEVLRGIRARTANIVVGNHDAAAAGLMDISAFNPVARRAIEWTRGQLDEESLAYLARMPVALESDEILFVHAEVVDPGRFGYIDDLETAEENFAARDHRVTFVGHTHQPTLYCLQEDGSVAQLPDEDCTLDPDQRYIVNVGSVGEPRTFEDIRARYAIYDADTRKLYFRRIEFDPESYRRDLLESGLEATPFFLTVFDHQRAEEDPADRALADVNGATLNTTGEFEELVLPSGVDEELSSPSRPVPSTPPTRPHQSQKIPLAVLSLLVVVAGITALIATRNGDREPEPITVQVIPEVHVRLAPHPGSAGDGASANEVLSPIAPALEGSPQELSPVPSPMPAPLPTPLPTAGLVPDPKPVPPDPVPPPKPAPPPPLPELAGLKDGLLFYTSFDDDPGDPLARDLSGEGRDIDVSTARLEQSGPIGLSCQLDQKSGGLTSLAKPLPFVSDLAISFWIRQPAKPPVKEGEEEQFDPAGNLVSIPGFIDIRMEKDHVVANLDLAGAVLKLPLPRDDEWHHVLVVSDDGITAIWIDNATEGEPVAEALKTVPPGAVPVLIGSPVSQFAIDEIAIWNRRFSHEERLNVYRRGRHRSPVLSPAKVVAHWTFDANPGAPRISDLSGQHLLGAYKPWLATEAAAPSSIPLTLRANRTAAQILHVRERPEEAGTFSMTAEEPFTYEGWVRFSSGTGGTLGGTISQSDENSSPGWRVAVKRSLGANGFLAFIHESGSGKVQALSKEVPVFDGFAHHFAAVWDPAGSETQGSLKLYFDNKEVAAAELAHADLRPDVNAPFRIEVRHTPVILDELRFSSAVLQPRNFLTAGLCAHPGDDPYYKTESVLERRDRELRERKIRQLAARAKKEEERKEAEEEKKRLEEKEKREREAGKK